MKVLGSIPMPPGFRYKEAALRGRPAHDGIDAFTARHPHMSVAKRAKIFAPYDALKGFSDAIAAKDVQYVPRQDPGEDGRAELDRRLELLRRMSEGARSGRRGQDRPVITVTCFVPCEDPSHEAFGHLGQYVQCTGIFLKADRERRCLFLLETDGGDAFEKDNAGEKCYAGEKGNAAKKDTAGEKDNTAGPGSIEKDRTVKMLNIDDILRIDSPVRGSEDPAC